MVLSSLAVGVNRLGRRHGAGSSSWRVGQSLKEGIVLLKGGESKRRNAPTPLSLCGLEAWRCGPGLLSLTVTVKTKPRRCLDSAGEREGKG